SGASVTMPLKENVKELLDEIDPVAQKIGAVNTLFFRKGKVKGFNTDCIGALNAIEEQSGLVIGKKIVILGAGGAAKAIVYEACKRGAKVVILNRRSEKAQQLANQFNCEGYGLESIHEIYQQGYDILINCTPSSMPIEPQYILEKAVIMDIVSKPKETPFLQEAIKIGCQVIFGYDMFINQAKEQHQIWFFDSTHK
ncbi:MAG: shikimate dehydrogenase, partial [Parachlamydiaceae bacterium]|nr:shikimate dehydrogenase [Parachlamydiaceae bacterium]